ncbi:hypothetical protein Tco_0018711 [Tanacetum coccineum]
MTIDHYAMNSLWKLWNKNYGNEEVNSCSEPYVDKVGGSDVENKVVEIFRIKTNLFNYETLLCIAFKEFNHLLQIDPNMLTDDVFRIKNYEEYKNDWEPVPVKHRCEPFNYKNGCFEWPTCSWKDDGYCNERNLPRQYQVGNQIHYQDHEWYEALEDSDMKREALRNKAELERSMNQKEGSSSDL